MILILKNQKNRFTEVLSGVKNINFVNINSKPSSKEFIEDRILEYASNNSSPLFQSVSVASLYFAMNIGFKKIYLFGFDGRSEAFIPIGTNNNSKIFLNKRKSDIILPETDFFKNYSSKKNCILKIIV